MALPSTPDAKAPASRAKSATVSPFDKSQMHQVVALYGEVFGKAGARDFDARFRWSQEENGLRNETKSWALVDGARLVGFLATVPQRFRAFGRDVIVHSSCDFMVHPDYRFYGISLMREYFKACENAVSLDDMPATIALLKMMKAKPVGSATRYVRVLDARIARDRVARLSRAPAPLFAPLTWGLRAYDRARATFRLAKVRPLADFDARFDRFFASTVGPQTVSLVRDATYLRWRYGQSSPHRSRTIGIATDEHDELVGYVVSATSKSASDRSGYIFELHALPGSSPGVYGALLTFACRQIRREGGHLARLHWMASQTGAPISALSANHFQKRTHEHVLLAKFRDGELDGAAADAAMWDYGFGDAEASHSVGS